MILIDNRQFSFDEIDNLISFFHENAFVSSEKKHADILDGYLKDCRKLDTDLQMDVERKISRDLISVVKIPFDEADDFSTLEFELRPKENRKITKREKLLYDRLCKKYLKGFEDLISRVES